MSTRHTGIACGLIGLLVAMIAVLSKPAVLRGDLDWIVMKCLEKERDRRFVTAGSLAQDVERYLNDEPVTACPPSLAYRARKAYRKNRAAIWVAATIALLLV